jgi:S-formylglutathione hydrolase FrmB
MGLLYSARDSIRASTAVLVRRRYVAPLLEADSHHVTEYIPSTPNVRSTIQSVRGTGLGYSVKWDVGTDRSSSERFNQKAGMQQSGFRRFRGPGFLLVFAASVALMGVVPAASVHWGRSIIRIHSELGVLVRPTTSMVVRALTVDANGVQGYQVTSVYQGSQPQVVRVLEPTNPRPGRPRRLLYVLPVEAGVTNHDSQYGDGLEELRQLDVPNRFNMTLIAPSFGYEPWYGDNVTDRTMRLETFFIRDLVPWSDSFLPAGTTPQRFVLGFSKSGNGALTLIFRHPNVFSAAAAWDSPAQLNNITAFSGLAFNFGTQTNYNDYFIPTLVRTAARPFTSNNRLWISGDQSDFPVDMEQLHSQLTKVGIPHTWVAGRARVHSWRSGWLDAAVTALDANASRIAPLDIKEPRVIASVRRIPRFTSRAGTQEIWIADKSATTAVLRAVR